MATYSGGVPMLKIDGSKVKWMREEKGLTQLYLATSVDVTTDTISRWENKRYPTIKKENALKLAEALEVDLAEILEEERLADAKTEAQGVDELRPQIDIVHQEKKAKGPKTSWFLGLGLLILIVLGVAGWSLLLPKKVEMAAIRVAPAHVVPGGLFPVVVKVDVGAVPASFILKEIVPSNCSLIPQTGGSAVFDRKTGELKWLVKAKAKEVVLGYMLRPDAGLKAGAEILFAGRVTQRRARGEARSTTGPVMAAVSRYHWADFDENGVIDDEEILAVYDDFDEIDGVSLDMDLIEEIWFGSGYRWDSEKRQFIVKP